MFNERNLWISVTVRSFTSTKTFLAINLSTSPGINHIKNEKLHWFEGKKYFAYEEFLIKISFFFVFSLAIKLSDTGADKSSVDNNFLNYWQQEQNNYSINELALNDELQSIINNIE